MFELLLVIILYLLPLIDSYGVEFKQKSRYSHSLFLLHSKGTFGGTKSCMKLTLNSSKSYFQWVLSLVLDVSPSVRNPRQFWILDSPPWIQNSRFWILDSLSVELGFGIPFVSGIPDSLSIPGSKIFQVSNSTSKNIPDSGIQISLHVALCSRAQRCPSTRL